VVEGSIVYTPRPATEKRRSPSAKEEAGLLKQGGIAEPMRIHRSPAAFPAVEFRLSDHVAHQFRVSPVLNYSAKVELADALFAACAKSLIRRQHGLSPGKVIKRYLIWEFRGLHGHKPYKSDLYSLAFTKKCLLDRSSRVGVNIV
jgi:hypothetical protein